MCVCVCCGGSDSGSSKAVGKTNCASDASKNDAALSGGGLVGLTGYGDDSDSSSSDSDSSAA